VKCKITIEGPSGPIRPFVLEDLTECMVEDLETNLGMARWLAQTLAENPWILRDCGVGVESTRMFTIVARMERLNDPKEKPMSDLTFVSNPQDGGYPEFTHQHYIGHNSEVPTYLLTNEEHCRVYGYPTTRDIIEGYLRHVGAIDEESHCFADSDANWEGFTQVTFEFGPIERITHEED
jgi:hypothetical protein